MNIFGVLVVAGKRGRYTASTDWGRVFALKTGDQFTPCSRFRWVSQFCGRLSAPTAGFPVSGRRERILEKRWQEFFSDPSQWWDHRPEKTNSRFPDFKHKKTKESLWLMDTSNPCWVKSELASMSPGALQSNIFSWNVRLRRYAKAGDYRKALDLFQQMQQEGVIPDKFTFVPVINACSSLLALEEGRHIHLQIIKNGFEFDVFVGSCLVDMYAKCGNIDLARRVFNKMPRRDVFAWNAMILGYVRCGQGHEALELSRRMQSDGVDLDSVTFVGVLNACANTAAFEEGRRAHEQIIDKGYESDVFVANALVDMYAKCGRIEDARAMFDNMLTRDVVAWSAMISGYVKSGQGQKALDLFEEMGKEGVHPDPIVFVGVLNACARTGALEQAKRAHEQIIDRGYESDIYVANALVDMYAKCGSLEDAQRVFSKMRMRDVVPWSAMLAGYGLHGYAKEALEGFEQMCQEGVEVNGVTFVSLLSACSHGGLVDEGLHYFESMTLVFNISPTAGHYACLVDLLGRSGRLHEAEDLIGRMPCEPEGNVWTSLLSACRAHGNVEMGEWGAKQLLEFNPQSAAGYVLLSNIYAAAGKWDRVHYGGVEDVCIQKYMPPE